MDCNSSSFSVIPCAPLCAPSRYVKMDLRAIGAPTRNSGGSRQVERMTESGSTCDRVRGRDHSSVWVGVCGSKKGESESLS